jgi:hypothetical protein
MRFELLARRIMAPALGLALAATVAACSSSSSSTPPASSGSSSASAPASSASAPSAPASSASSSASSPGNSAAAQTQIKANWEKFFNGKTSAEQKIALLQNGQKFADAIRGLASSPLFGSASAKVKAVVVNSATSATVSYDILVAGAAALKNQTGTAVYEGGTWKVGDVSLCQLLKLQGGAPAACNNL